MNSPIIWGLAGLAIGAGVTYLIVEPVTRKRLQKEFDADLDEMREYYHIDREQELELLSEDMPVLETTISEREVEKIRMNSSANINRYHNSYSESEMLTKHHKNKNHISKPDLSLVLEKDQVKIEMDPEYTANEPEYILDPENFGLEEEYESDNKSIYTVESSEYHGLDPETDPSWNKVSLNYYAKDGVLVYEETGKPEVIVDKAMYIGSVGEEILSNWYDEEHAIAVEGDSIYVRNEIRNTYYHVIYFEDESFYTD